MRLSGSVNARNEGIRICICGGVAGGGAMQRDVHTAAMARTKGVNRTHASNAEEQMKIRQEGGMKYRREADYAEHGPLLSARCPD